MSAKSTNKYVIAIAGPTAVGKTKLALRVAREYDTVIVSADSRQMYRDMDIGTAKPTADELQAVSHYFIDHLDIQQPYDAGTFEREVLALLEKLFAERDVVILVGGSGLYLRAVLEGFDDLPDTDTDVRKKWERVLETDGLGALQDALKEADPAYFDEVDTQNPRRLIRALVVIEQTGKPYSELRQQRSAERPFRAIRIFCNRPREEVYERINHRVDAMIKEGLVKEVEELLPFRDLQSLQTVGYRELFDYLDGQCTLDEAVEKIKQHTRNYAKRQVTWFRNQGDWAEFNPDDIEAILIHIQKQIQ